MAIKPATDMVFYSAKAVETLFLQFKWKIIKSTEHREEVLWCAKEDKKDHLMNRKCKFEVLE